MKILFVLKVIALTIWGLLSPSLLYADELAATAIKHNPSTTAVERPAGDVPGRASHPLDTSTGPAIGKINGIKISIPHYYLLSGVQYEGEEPLMMIPRKYIPTFDTNIQDFAILLRLSNMQPIRTDQDERDYDQAQRNSGHVSSYETWTTIGFSPKWYDDTGSLKGVVTEWETDKAHWWGPFVMQKERISGLVHEDSTQPIHNDKDGVGHFDFFYDDGTFDTFIYCQTFRRLVPPNDLFNSCNHLFVIPELKVVAEATYTKNDLPRWREIEKESKSIIHSFIVQ